MTHHLSSVLIFLLALHDNVFVNEEEPYDIRRVGSVEFLIERAPLSFLPPLEYHDGTNIVSVERLFFSVLLFCWLELISSQLVDKLRGPFIIIITTNAPLCATTKKAYKATKIEAEPILCPTKDESTNIPNNRP